MVRSQKELAVFLSKLEPISNPKQQLEQYSTDSEAAAILLWQAYINGHITDTYVVDLGCGTGILGIGALLLGAIHVEFMDIDAGMYTGLKKNLAIVQEHWEIKLEGKWTFTNTNIATCKKTLRDDALVVMNPPFGTQIKHADKLFLSVAKTIAPRIYTMHKTSTTTFIEKYAQDNQLIIRWQHEMSYPLKQTLPQHTKRLERINVSLFCLEKI